MILAPLAVGFAVAATAVATQAGPLAGSLAGAAAQRGPSAVQPVAVFGDDDRVPLPDSKAALTSSIGLIHEPGSQSTCTAFCVGDDVAATAGHCLFRTGGDRPPRLPGFTFRLNPKGAKSLTTRIAGAGHKAASQHVVAGTLKLRVKPPLNAASDWALVKLEEPICKGRALALSPQPARELVALSTAQRVYQVSFHRDFGDWDLALGRPCAIRRSFGEADWRSISKDFTDARDVILHTCDTGEASSGSPLLIDGPGGPEVIGISVGTYLQSRVLTQKGQVVHRYKARTLANTGVSADAFRDALDALQRADIVANLDDVRDLQRLLSAEGYAVGALDGLYGPNLNGAIRAFERAEGRRETGLATMQLLKRLAARDAQRRGGEPRPLAPAAHIETGALGAHAPRHDRLRDLAR